MHCMYCCTFALLVHCCCLLSAVFCVRLFISVLLCVLFDSTVPARLVVASLVFSSSPLCVCMCVVCFLMPVCVLALSCLAIDAARLFRLSFACFFLFPFSLPFFLFLFLSFLLSRFPRRCMSDRVNQCLVLFFRFEVFVSRSSLVGYLPRAKSSTQVNNSNVNEQPDICEDNNISGNGNGTQVNEELERTQYGGMRRVPERFSDVGAASDYLSSLVVRTSEQSAGGKIEGGREKEEGGEGK